MFDQRHFWLGENLYREMNSWERKQHDEARDNRASRRCEEFLHPNFEIGDELTSTHTAHTHGHHKPAPCILLSVNKFGFGKLLMARYDELFSEYDSEDEIEVSQTNGHGLTLVKKCPLALDELLCSDFEGLRQVGLNIIEHRKLRRKIMKMSKKRRISEFRSRHVDPDLEYAVACPSETIWYQRGFDRGYAAALRDEEESFYGSA